jgi:hypothetical protein
MYKEWKFSCRKLTLFEDVSASKFRFSPRGTTSSCNIEKLIQDFGLGFGAIYVGNKNGIWKGIPGSQNT